jgi:Probable cobalt transporter subunit (CbtB)
MSTTSATPLTTPLVVPISRSTVWLVGTALLAFAIYYFVGIDQGATSVFGNDTHVHEFVHDARHFLGFPCH